MQLYVDNQSAIRLIHNPEFHKRTKHINVKFHYIYVKVEDGEINVSFVPIEIQLADIFTKPLSKSRLIELCISLRLCIKRSNGRNVETDHRI